MKGLGILSDFDLLEVYEKAVKMNLEKDFTDLLLMEIDRRGIRDLEPFVC